MPQFGRMTKRRPCLNAISFAPDRATFKEIEILEATHFG